MYLLRQCKENHRGLHNNSKIKWLKRSVREIEESLNKRNRRKKKHRIIFKTLARVQINPQQALFETIFEIIFISQKRKCASNKTAFMVELGHLSDFHGNIESNFASNLILLHFVLKFVKTWRRALDQTEIKPILIGLT